MTPTPKIQDRKRKHSSGSLDTPAKKRTGRSKETVINLDVEDPFNFEKKEDSHPEPLKNISIERTAFGGVKFSKSPPSALQRYVSVEKIAERRGNVSGTVTPANTSTPRPGSLSSLNSSFNLHLKSGSSNNTVATLKPTKPKKTPSKSQTLIGSKKVGVEENVVKDEKVTSEILNTPSLTLSKRRSKLDFEASATPKEKKLTLDDYCVVPILSPNEQLQTDHGEEHKLLDAGARVLALWGHDYYAANICGRDGLSRYYVHFVEDNLNRLLPPNGVVPLSSLKNGATISFIAVQDDQEIGKQAIVAQAPSYESAVDWASGLFKLHVEDEGDFENVSWEKIFLTKDQHKVISATAINTTIDVEQENIVNESRSSRRSRSTRFSLDSGSVTANPATPKFVSRSKTPKVTKSPILFEENVEKTPEKNELVKNEADELEKTNIRLTRRSTTSAAAIKTPLKIPKVQPKTPKGRSTRKSTTIVDDEKIVKDEVSVKNTEETIAEEDTEEIESNKIETILQEDQIDPEPENINIEKPVELNVSLKEDIVPAIDFNSNDNDDNGVSEEHSLSDIMEVDKTPVKVNNGINSVDESISDIKRSCSDDVSEKNEAIKDETNSIKNDKLSIVFDTAVVADATDLQPLIVAKNVNENTLPVVDNEANTDASTKNNHSSSSEIIDTHAVATVQSSSNSLESVSISLISPPSNKEEATIFQNMKFVLTSATRSKKNSDFQKRDYRTKIEERGGEIIEDFSVLKEGDNAFLIADTYYRTHKYLSALSISVPCVKHNWILACVSEKCLLDHIPFMLPAGESSLDRNKICEWKPLKNVLLRNKRVWVCSNITSKTDERSIGFVKIWSSIIKNLGAELVDQTFSSLVEKLDFCAKSPVDILLTDSSCEKELAERVEAEGGIAVSSEWVIHAIVTGELPDIGSSECFCFDSTA